jgi:16S rRNA (uracil1498-N3)-methyltransferase
MPQARGCSGGYARPSAADRVLAATRVTWHICPDVGIHTCGPHFFVGPADIENDHAVLRGDEARHLTIVLRAAAGDAVSLSDGVGRCWQARVLRATRGEVTFRLGGLRRVPRPRPRLTVVHALPKGRKLDEVIKRLAEIGVDRLVPVCSARSEVQLTPDRAAKAVKRWRAVALAAAKQSRRAWLLDVDQVETLPAALSRAAHGVVLWEEATVPLREVCPFADVDELVLGIGPEGGLTADEVTASGLPAASLGETILRTETAALVAASILLHRLDRLG